MSGRRSKLDRFQYDGDDLDEIVLSNVTFHIERMSHHGWWLGVRDPKTGEDLSMWWSATAEPVLETDQWRGAEIINREPLAYWCDHRWADRRGSEHQCVVGNLAAERNPDHVRHRCECGATTRRVTDA